MSELMPAVAYRENRPIEDGDSLLDVRLPVPTPGPHDLLVRVQAVSVNPIDTKVRSGSVPGSEDKVLGYDASGVVSAVGSEVTLFVPGDEVFYAGSIARPGTNARFHLVDERLTGPKPRMLSFAEAAALPLTTITAWESLFDRLRLTRESTGTLLVLGAAGGVGSIMLQLVRALTGVTAIATASRSESREWALKQGAHHVVDHHGDLAAQVLQIAPDGVDYVFSPHSGGLVETFARIVKPYGHVVAVDEPDGLDLVPLKSKSIAWHWELMFTRPMFDPDSRAQHDLLAEASRLFDDGTLHHTMTTLLGPINAAQLRDAHALVEDGSTVGKIVVAGF